MPQTYRLPKEAYTTDKWMQAEFASLFSNAWVFAGVETDFQNVGDYRTVQAGLYPLAIVKAKDGTLQATHNVCRHRGTVLLDGQGNTGQSIVCPYHRWTYGLDGALRGAPNMATCFPELDRTKLALKQAGLGIFKGLIFLNPNPNANFNNWLSEIGEEIWPHNLEAEDIQEGPSLIYDMKCDWKVFVENAIDGYHLSYLHEHTLGGPTPDQNLWERRGEHLIWFSTENKGVRSALPAKVQSDIEKSWATPIKGTDISGYPGVVHLFPTTMVIPTPYGFSVSSLIPTAPGNCRMHVRNWTRKGQARDHPKHIPGFDRETGVISSDHWKKHPLETGDFQTEDVWICEKLQRGIASPAYEHGPLAKGAGAEEPIEWFHHTLRQYLVHDL